MLSLGIRKASVLDVSIDRVIKQMEHVGPGAERYDELLTKLERLMTLRNQEKRNEISLDTVVVVCANLLGILIIVGYEQGHVVASRGLGLLLKSKYQ